MDGNIRIRVCLAAVEQDRILLLPHYNTDVGPVQWCIPGGRLEFGETLQEAAIREFREETGLHAAISRLLDVTEVVLPERPWHSISVIFLGQIVGGEIKPETGHRYGEKVPQWFSRDELDGKQYHPRDSVEKALTGS